MFGGIFMQKIAILTDSASDLNITLLEKHNIKYLPFRIIYSDKEYEDVIEISPEEVYSSFEKEIPTTSLPSIEKIEKIFLIDEYRKEDRKLRLKPIKDNCSAFDNLLKNVKTDFIEKSNIYTNFSSGKVE